MAEFRTNIYFSFAKRPQEEPQLPGDGYVYSASMTLGCDKIFHTLSFRPFTPLP